MQTPLGKLRVPHSKAKRQVLGWSLVAGGVLGFLPVLGFWMLPLGLAMLSIDSPSMRRKRRRWLVTFGRSSFGARLRNGSAKGKSDAKGA
jgi:hypothetical protein